MTTFTSIAHAAAGVALSLCATLAPAAIVTFNNLPGANLSPFTSYTESGFTVSTVSGQPCVGSAFGNPAPSVVGGTVCPNGGAVELKVTGSGTFAFASLDMSANNGATSYTFTGMLAGGTVFSTSSSLANGAPLFNFVTISSTSNQLIDELRLSFTPSGTSFNVDNIALNVGTTTVPEPGSLALVLAAGGLLVAARRRAG